MLGYWVLASCAHVCRKAPETELRTRIREATAASPFRLIGFSGKICDAALDPFHWREVANRLLEQQFQITPRMVDACGSDLAIVFRFRGSESVLYGSFKLGYRIE
jgi:hypothetical protein